MSRRSEPRRTVKLLLVAPDDRVLLIHATDSGSGRRWWYPVGGGVEPGESLQEAARRETHEETGLAGDLLSSLLRDGPAEVPLDITVTS